MLPTDDEPVAVINDRYWRGRFGANPSVIGKTITIGKQALTIVGITPPEFFGVEAGNHIDLTVPISTAGNILANPEAQWLHGIIACRRPSITNSQAQTESTASSNPSSPAPATRPTSSVSAARSTAR